MRRDFDFWPQKSLTMQRWLTWIVALLLIAGVTAVVVVFLMQGDGPPEYVTAISDGTKSPEKGHFDSPAGVTIDSGGNLFVLDTNNNRIQRLDPDGTVLEIFGDPGSADGLFSAPLRLKFNSEGILWVADTDNNRLQSFNTKGEFLTTVGSLGQGPGQFSRPIGLTFDVSGNMWVADSGNHRIQKFGPGMKNVLAIIPENPEPSSKVGFFNTPWGVACDATGTIYVTDTENHRVQRFLKDGTFVKSFGTPGNKPGEFNKPTDILIDRQGNLFISDSGNNRIQKFDPQGKFICEWGKMGNLAREFNNPQQIAEGQDGTMYIADCGNNRVQKYRARKNPLFTQDGGVQIPTKPKANGPSETPLVDLPEVPTDATPGASGTPAARPTPAPTAAAGSGTPAPEPTNF